MINNYKLFSIIIPVYNKKEYLSECLDSCLQQDIPSDEYEIICIDDCSTDGSSDILDLYQNKYNNIIHVIHKSINEGVSTARNLGIEEAKGKYIYFLDADDFIEQNCLSAIKELTKSDPDTIIVKNYTMLSDILSDNELKLKEQNKLNGSTVCIGSYFYKKELILSTNIRFRTDISLAEDAIFRYEYQLIEQKVISYDKIIHFYRYVSNSLLHRPRTQKIDSYIALVKLYKEFYDKKIDNLVFLEYHLFLRIHDAVNTIVRLPFNDWNKYISQLKEIGVYNLKPSPAAVEKFISKKAEGKPDTRDKTIKSFKAGASKSSFFIMYCKVKLSKVFN